MRSGAQVAGEQINISVPPQIARFVRRKVRTGGYADASDVVRAALRRMQEDEAREVRSSRSRVDEILADISAAEQSRIRDRVQAAVDGGEFTEYVGAAGLRQLAAEVKARGRQKLTKRSQNT